MIAPPDGRAPNELRGRAADANVSGPFARAGRGTVSGVGGEATRTAALGWRSHSGWAVIVAVGGSPADPIVLDRERVELLDGSLPRQPYHAAAEGALSLDDAASLISQVERAAALSATTATASIAAKLSESGIAVVGVGLAVGARSIPVELTRVLASHLLLHAAEGQLYEEALIEASARAGLPVTTLGTKTILEDAAAAMGVTVAELGTGLASAGKLAGPPWQKDHREAAASALVALSAKPSG
jgi:hypothetical protein